MSEFRTLAALGADMQVRSDGDGRTITGIAVPWNRPTRISDRLVESFAPGAFRAQLRAAHRVPLARNHMRHGGQLIGRVTEMRDDAAGLYVEARVANTSLGTETLELVRDGALDGLSIGFVPMQNESVKGVTVRTAARLIEVAIVLDPAYGEASTISGVRSVEEAAIAAAEALEAAEQAELDEEESRTRLELARDYSAHLARLFR